MIVNNVAQKLVKPMAMPSLNKPSRMSLSSITKGKQDQPIRVVLFGQEGVGKSTFAAGAPDPIFLCSESGTHRLDVARFPTPNTWTEALEAIDVLTNEEHSYKSLVVDTLDWLEPLVFAHVIANSGMDKNGRKATTIEASNGGFGRGYVAALDQWRIFISKVEKLQTTKGLHVLLLAHAWIKGFNNPEGDNFDRYELKIDKRASGKIKEWADAVLFGTWDKSTVSNGSKSRGISNGARIIHTEWSAAFDAKNRYGLPDRMPLSWDEFFACVQEGKPASIESMLIEARGLANAVGLGDKVELLIEKAGEDVTKVAQILDWVRGKVQLIEEKEVA